MFNVYSNIPYIYFTNSGSRINNGYNGHICYLILWYLYDIFHLMIIMVILKVKSSSIKVFKNETSLESPYKVVRFSDFTFVIS